MYDPTLLIARISTTTMPWGAPSDPVIAAMANAPGRKLLREDPRNGERTWMLKMGADNPATFTEMRTETHPVVEESFLLAGEISMQCGVQQPGAYFWRPAGIEHGPVGTRKDMMGFFRTKGGPLSTNWSAKPKPMVWDVPYRPTLTPAAQEFAYKPYDSSRIY
jgi:hypothetical protein